MPIGTSDGRYYENDFDHQHALTFGEPQQDEGKGEGKTFFVRHGDTDLNNEDIIHGWVDTPLNDEGVEDAHKAAESLKDKNITRIISSDLPRAKQTANILSQKLKVPVTFDSNLRTWDSGDFDGTKDHEEFKKYTQQADMFDTMRDLGIIRKQPQPGPYRPDQDLPDKPYGGKPKDYKPQPRSNFDYIQEPGESEEDFHKRIGPDSLDNWYEYAPVEGGGMGWKVRQPKTS